MQEAGQGARKQEATLQPGELGQITDQIADGAMEQAVARLSLGRPLRSALEPGCVRRSPTAGASNSPQVGMNSIMKGSSIANVGFESIDDSTHDERS